MKKILTIPNPVLFAHSKPITDFGKTTQSLIKDMELLLRADLYGVGLSAPQIGESVRLILVTQPGKNKNYLPLINPEISFFSKEVKEDYEGCLSIPFKVGLIERSVKIKLKAQNKDGQFIQLRAANFFARQIQHEVDHLNGILFPDRTVPEKVFPFSIDKDGAWIIEKTKPERLDSPA